MYTVIVLLLLLLLIAISSTIARVQIFPRGERRERASNSLGECRGKWEHTGFEWLALLDTGFDEFDC